MKRDETHNTDVLDLEHEDAIRKIKELVRHDNICMFVTRLTEVPLQARPMSTQEVDDEGNFWFLSSKDSHKNLEIGADSRVQLFFCNKKDSEFLSVFGRASVLKDKEKIKEVWSPVVKAWFHEGKDDPHLTAIKVTPHDAYYWDTKNGKTVTLIKILSSAVAGKTMDAGVEGKLNV